mgnify:CR=1 FL=1
MSDQDFELSQFLPYQLAVLAERVSRRLSVEYGRTHGLNVAEWRVLVHLMRRREVSVREIHERVNLDKPRVSRAVSRLEAAGLVEKAAAEDDARLVAISLTPRGMRVLDDILPSARDVEANLLTGLSDVEQAVFLAAIEKLHGVLDDDPEARPRSKMDGV